METGTNEKKNHDTLIGEFWKNLLKIFEKNGKNGFILIRFKNNKKISN